MADSTNATDGFADVEKLAGIEAKTASNGAKVLGALYYVALGVAAIWVYRKLFKK